MIQLLTCSGLLRNREGTLNMAAAALVVFVIFVYLPGVQSQFSTTCKYDEVQCGSECCSADEECDTHNRTCPKISSIEYCIGKRTFCYKPTECCGFNSCCPVYSKCCAYVSSTCCPLDSECCGPSNCCPKGSTCCFTGCCGEGWTCEGGFCKSSTSSKLYYLLLTIPAVIIACCAAIIRRTGNKHRDELDTDEASPATYPTREPILLPGGIYEQSYNLDNGRPTPTYAYAMMAPSISNSQNDVIGDVPRNTSEPPSTTEVPVSIDDDTIINKVN